MAPYLTHSTQNPYLLRQLLVKGDESLLITGLFLHYAGL